MSKNGEMLIIKHIELVNREFAETGSRVSVGTNVRSEEWRFIRRVDCGDAL
jgi:hypothetical protein